MTFEEFKKKCVEAGFFKPSNSANVAKGERIGIKGKGLDIASMGGYEVNNPVVGFNIRHIFNLQPHGGEFVFISGTESKNGIYFFEKGPEIMTAGDLDGDLETISENGFEFVGDYDEYSELSADEKVEVFEDADQLAFQCKTYEEFFNQLEKVKIAA